MNNWHYPRQDLAKVYLDILNTGLTSTIALFAPRRTGKTEFSMQDLLPLAEESGMDTYVVDFWANEDSPEHCITQGFRQSLVTLSAKKQFKSLQLKNLTAGIAGLNATIDNPDINSINQAFETLHRIYSSGETKVLLFLDGVQHLATRPEFSIVASALRTFIDKNKSWLKVVLTGSSQDGLQRLFNQKNSAFYQSVSVLDFPRLDAAYVQHTIRAFEEITSKQLNLNQSLRAFKALSGNPETFKSLIQGMLLSGTTDIEDAMEKLKSSLNNQEDTESRWNALSDIDSSVLRLIAHRATGKADYGLYSQTAFDAIAIQVHENKITKSTIQNAIERLRTRGWIYNTGRGHWVFENNQDLEWIETNT